MSPTKSLQAVLCLTFCCVATAAANASFIWGFTATFGAAVGGPDTEQLAGATFTATYDVSAGNYVDFFGTPAAPVNLALTSFTISGSGIPANNATYAPTFPYGGSSLFFLPNAWGGNNAQITADVVAAITLPSGSHLTFGPTIASTPSATPPPPVGSPILGSHFPLGPGDPSSFAPAVNPPTGPAITYGPTGATFVPEPASLVMLLVGMLVMFARRGAAVP